MIIVIYTNFAPAKDKQKGTDSFPSSFSGIMSNETQIAVLEELAQEVIADDNELFLVHIRIKPTNNIRVYIDGDNGISIGKLASLNKVLYKKLEEKALYPDGEFSLELSSPGLDEPLKLHRQYVKNIGRFVEVITEDGLKHEGKLKAVTDNSVIISEERGKNKKKEIIEHTILFDNIKTTKIQIKF